MSALRPAPGDPGALVNPPPCPDCGGRISALLRCEQCGADFVARETVHRQEKMLSDRSIRALFGAARGSLARQADDRAAPRASTAAARENRAILVITLIVLGVLVGLAIAFGVIR